MRVLHAVCLLVFLIRGLAVRGSRKGQRTRRQRVGMVIDDDAMRNNTWYEEIIIFLCNQIRHENAQNKNDHEPGVSCPVLYFFCSMGCFAWFVFRSFVILLLFCRSSSNNNSSNRSVSHGAQMFRASLNNFVPGTSCW